MTTSRRATTTTAARLWRSLDYGAWVVHSRSAAWVAELDEIRAELSDIASTTPFSDDVKRLIRDASITLAHAQDLMEAEGDA